VIYDCFLYDGEADILELRFGVLGDIVDTFVVVEGTVTFSGKPKPVKLNLKDSRFAPYAAKARHVVVADTPDSGGDRWAREHFQREAIMRGLQGCHADDLICVSDVDEIPDPKQLQLRIRGGYQCQISNYWLNTVEAGSIWVGPALGYYFELKTYGPERWRNGRYNFRRVDPGGWHFTYCAPEQRIVEKLQAFSHAEYDTPEQHQRVLTARCDLRSFVSGQTMRVDDIDAGYYPQFLKDHKDRFQHLVYAR
jgi:hypothetical protein